MNKYDYIVYKTTDIKTGLIYIGYDSYNRPYYFGSGYYFKNVFHSRIREYVKKKLHIEFNEKEFNDYKLKYAPILFKKETLEHFETKELMLDGEIKWIAHFKSQNPEIGYNISPGGIWGDTFTNNPNKEEIRKKHQKKQSPETIQKRILKNTGQKRTQSSKDKISLANINRFDTPSLTVYQYDLKYNLIQKFHSILYAAKVTKVSYTSIRACANNVYKTGGKFIWSFNLLSDNDILKLKQNYHKGSKLIYQYDLNDVFIKEWTSIKAASIETNTNIVSISYACNGKQKTAGGFKWRYAEKNI